MFLSKCFYWKALEIAQRRANRSAGLLHVRCYRVSLAFNNESEEEFTAGAKSAVERIKGLTEVRKTANEVDICVMECMLCQKGNRSKIDNLWKLQIRPNGSFYCFRCSKKGGLSDLLRNLDAHSGSGGNNARPKVNETHRQLDNNYTVSSRQYLEKKDQSEKDKKSFIIPDQQQMKSYNSNLFPSSSDPSHATQTLSPLVLERQQRVLTYLQENRMISNHVLQKYQVGWAVQQFLSNEKDKKWVDHVCVTFPWIMTVQDEVTEEEAADEVNDDDFSDDNNSNCTEESAAKVPTIVRMKFRSLESKGFQRISPKGGRWGFFGWHLVDINVHKSIIITEGEYDCMAVSDALSALPESDPLRHVPAISLPNGCNSLPVELVPLLDSFKKIYLWLDNDKSGQDSCDKFARKLGTHRCVIVRPLANATVAPKDANDALRLEGSIAQQIIPNMLRKAKPLTQSNIQNFGDLREDVLSAVRSARYAGAGVRGPDGWQATSISKLTEICKGFRKKELVILTGPTGSGKTTLLSQLSIDFAAQGVPTLWGSFEIKNVQLVKQMLQQYYKFGHLNRLSEEELESVANDFDSLPLQFMNFYGPTDIMKVLELMDCAVHVDDVQQIIIDNLQFMMPVSPRGFFGSKTGFEKFEHQDEIIHHLRKFATEKNVNIILVIHPRKESDLMPLSIASIFGTAKATQEADLVLIIQKMKEKMSLDVKKNRYDGTVGSIPLGFNPVIRCFAQVEEAPKK